MRQRQHLVKAERFASRRSLIHSIEVWPARSATQRARLRELLLVLKTVQPDFVTVTYGAMGSSRERTIALIEELVGEGFAVVAHLACLGNTRDELVELIHRYVALGACGILALRGDPPLEGAVDLPLGELHYASELVELIHQESDLPVAVALHPDGHPDAVDLLSDREFAAQKLAHADLGLTQFFFAYPSFAHLRLAMIERGVTTPVIPGLMVPSSSKQLQRMAEMAGIAPPDGAAVVPDSGVDDSAVFQSQALETAITIAQMAIADGVRGIHLFSMNNAEITLEFFTRLRAIEPS
ncbi:methylenetetrahydrofolate reductase [Ferrimicrobium sp.]|uniref:methylenetetrahydrofolate reductase n=1 Tax=Ferrimicrobium sp. TaxID=2926050 RepID=UPI00261C57AB|nr:methylenetetrahydrofolate reductase [Ferrimicrobium sp.]